MAVKFVIDASVVRNDFLIRLKISSRLLNGSEITKFLTRYETNSLDLGLDKVMNIFLLFC